MSRNLPSIPERRTAVPMPVSEPGRVRRWLRSPLGTAVVDAAPDLLRATGRAVRSRDIAELPSTGANGMTVSEVEIDVATPFIRRVTVRSSSAWSLAPEVILERRGRRWGGRLGMGAAGLAGLALLGLAAVRRSPLAIGERLREK